MYVHGFACRSRVTLLGFSKMTHLRACTTHCTRTYDNLTYNSQPFSTPLQKKSLLPQHSLSHVLSLVFSP